MTASDIPRTLARWNLLSGNAMGRWLFTRAVCFKAPYFATISPRILTLQPGLCVVTMPKRRAVENHIGTVHALAAGNLCELAAGLAIEVSLPPRLRWIPRGMTIEYLNKATTGLRATAKIDRGEWSDAENVGVPVTVTDNYQREVVRAVITMYVAARAGSAG
ncbi:MAG: hotdog fold domain-containing protein [Steroidobacteraceae bacterium]